MKHAGSCEVHYVTIMSCNEFLDKNQRSGYKKSSARELTGAGKGIAYRTAPQDYWFYVCAAKLNQVFRFMPNNDFR